MAVYDRRHRELRAALKPGVDAGLAECAELICLEERDGRSRWIRPGTEWDLAHDRAAGPGHYLGPAHASCNRSEGARWRHRKSIPVHRQWAL